MTVGIIGAGSIGTAFACRLAQTNLSAILSNSRGPESLVDLVADIGGSIRARTRDEAAAQDLVLVAVNWPNLPAALSGLPDFGGRIVVDANNPIIAPSFQLAELHGRLSTEVFADRSCARCAGGESVQSSARSALGRRSSDRWRPARTFPCGRRPPRPRSPV
jgi:predicted dinucleotide-binding enzyme